MSKSNGTLTPAQFVGPAKTANYRPSVMMGASWLSWGIDGQVRFLWRDLERMRTDPQVQFAVSIILAPLATVTWEVESDSTECQEWVDRTLNRVWQNDLYRMTRLVEFGSVGGELFWRDDDDTGLIEFDRLQDMAFADCRPLQLDGKLAGVSLQVSSANREHERHPSWLRTPRSFWLALDPEAGYLYGQPRIAGCWQPWREKSGRHGALDCRRNWYVRCAFAGGKMRHPAGTIETGDGSFVSCQDYAREIVEKYETGAIMVLPNTVDDNGNKTWDFEDPKINDNATDIRKYPKDLDVEILRGAKIPPEVVEMAESGGSWSGRNIPFLVFLTGEDHITDVIYQAVDEQILKPGVAVNFGEGVKYKVKLKSLVPPVQEQPGGATAAGPAGMAGGEGGGGGPGLAGLLGGGPEQMSLLTNKVLAGLMGGGREVAKLSTVQLATADGAGFTGRRKDSIGRTICWENGKRIACHAHKDTEGRTHVDRVHGELEESRKAGITPEHVSKLAEHLSGMTLGELKHFKEKMGLKAGGKKSDLQQNIAALAAGIVGGKPPGKPPWEGGMPDLGKVYNAPTASLAVDPGRFQFKLNVDPTHGVTDELRQVKTFNPDFAGTVSVWKDPHNGKTYVVNGHHRHELATRTGYPDMAVRYVKAATAKEARAVGALINIAEGRGTAVDAAKFMRDMGVSPADMADHGISLKGKVAADAAVLTRLSDHAFDRLARGLLDEGKAVAVAKHLEDHGLQDTLFKLLAKREDEGKDLSPRVIEEMAREMASTPKTDKTEETLFGKISSEESLFVERNEVKAYVRSEMAKEVNDFLAVASKRRAERVGKVGNVLDTEANRKIAEDADRAKNVFDTLVNRKGAISDAVNAAAEEYSKAKTKGERDAVRKRAAEAVRESVFREAGIGGEGTGVR